MSPQYINHLTALEQAVRSKPNNTSFKVPSEQGWRDISYQELWTDVVRLAGYYSPRLEQLGIEKRDVIGLWIFGKTYNDALFILSLQRAGYIPHLMSTYVKDLDLVQSLFQQSGAKIIICDTARISGWERLELLGIKVIPILTNEEVDQITGSDSPVDLNILPSLSENIDGDDILSFEQSSGSSSGRPKLVPFTRRWVDANAQKCQLDERRTPVFIRSGSFCYVGQLLHSLRMFLYADCMVLTPKLIWEAEELANIITECGATDIALYSSLMLDVIEKAKTSTLLIEKLRTLNSLTFAGGPLSERAIEWAVEMGIKIVSRFASTEVGMLMVSKSGEPHILQFYRKFDYEFLPINEQEEDENSDNNSKWQELVILPTSPDCPPPPFRNPTDGKYHTKDLFERVGDGYIFRGRRDDIMIMEDCSNCDAKYLEDRIGYVCHDLISAFVIVGRGRPTPALLVEPQEELNPLTTTTFHNTLVARLEEPNSTSYPHEKIKPERIIVLPKGSLPISSLKGTVMRSNAESKFKSLLDKVYAGDSVWKEV